MKIGVPKEIRAGEQRVALTPETAGRILKLGFELAIESGAGDAAQFSDDAYREAGVEIVDDTRALWAGSDIVLKVRQPEAHPGLGIDETELVREGSTLISFVWPAQNEDLLEKIKARKATAIAMDAVPRISRAQKMDALSSMANIAGYRAVVEAANNFGRFFTGQITAAGKVPPAKVMVIGAGVAGLAAIGAARGMGAIVRAFDTRLEVKQQVESMGAEFLELEFEEDGSGGGGYAKVMSDEFIKAEMEMFAEQAKDVDIIITTALIPGKPAPKLITAEMVESMKPGSVVVDLAAEQGGNCELTVPGEVAVKHDVTLIGYMDLPSRMAHTASRFFSANVRHLLTDMVGEEGFVLDLEDEVVRAATQIHEGERLPPPPRKEPTPPPKPEPPREAAPRKEPEEESGAGKAVGTVIGAAIAAAAFALVGLFAPEDFVQHFTVFILACFVGWQIVWAVAPALHTPLMSVTNAISGIVLVGGLVQAAPGGSGLPVILGAVALLIGTINVAGGFLVTERMLGMFKKGGPK